MQTIVKSSPKPSVTTPTSLPTSHMGIVDSGASYLYIAPKYPFRNSNPTVPKVCVGTVNSHIEKLSAIANLPITQMIKEFPTNGHIMS